MVDLFKLSHWQFTTALALAILLVRAFLSWSNSFDSCGSLSPQERLMSYGFGTLAVLIVSMILILMYSYIT